MVGRLSDQSSLTLFCNGWEDMHRGGNKLWARLTGTDEGNLLASYWPCKLIESVVMELRSHVTRKHIDSIRTTSSALVLLVNKCRNTTAFYEKQNEPAWFRRLEQTVCRTLDLGFESHQCLHICVQVCGSKKLNCTCHSRGESDWSIESHWGSKGSILALKPRADFTSSPKQDISGLTKRTDVLQKNEHFGKTCPGFFKG